MFGGGGSGGPLNDAAALDVATTFIDGESDGDGLDDAGSLDDPDAADI